MNNIFIIGNKFQYLFLYTVYFNPLSTVDKKDCKGFPFANIKQLQNPTNIL